MTGKTAWLDSLKKRLETSEATDTRKAAASPPLLVDEFSESLIQPTDKTDKSPQEGTKAWDEDEAHKLIDGAFACLREQYLKAGKPGFDPAAVHAAYERIDKAYGAEDMGELRRALRAFVVAGIKGFRRRQRAA